jgi:hypothetical protein
MSATMKQRFASLRDVARPAPWEQVCKQSGFPFPRSMRCAIDISDVRRSASAYEFCGASGGEFFGVDRQAPFVPLECTDVANRIERRLSVL